MSYTNRNFGWDFDSLKSFYDRYVVKWLNSAESWTSAQKKQARANLGLGDGDIDDKPVAGSDNLVKSGGVQNELALGSVYDVSAKNPTAGSNNDGKWESLSALLSDTNLNTLIPTSVRKGGMSIKFVLISDNKYIQYRYMGTDITGTPNPFLDTANWQGVDDNEPTQGSKDIITSGAAYEGMLIGENTPIDITQYDTVNAFISYYSYGGYYFWITNNSQSTSKFIPVTAGKKYLVRSGVNNSYCAFLTTDIYPDTTGLEVTSFATGCTRVLVYAGNYTVLTAPSNAAYLWVSCSSNDNDRTPSEVSLYNKENIRDIKPLVDRINQDVKTLQEEFSDIKISEIPITQVGYYISLSNISIGDNIPEPIISFSGFSYSIYPVKSGDTVIVSGTGGSNGLLWGFASADNKLISKSEPNISVNELSLLVPENAAFVIINNNDETKTSYYDNINSLYNKLIFNEGCFKTFDNIKQLLSPEILINKGKNILSDLTIVDYAPMGYSAPIEVKKGNVLIAYGVRRYAPLYINCTENGEFLSAGTESEGGLSKQIVEFENDGYIIVQGYLYETQTYARYASLLLNSIDQPPIETVYSVDELSPTPNSITLDRLVIKKKNEESFTIYANGDESSHQPVTYTFSIFVRVLVIDTLDWSLKTRLNRQSCLETDYILLVYQTDRNIFIGGELLAQLVESRDRPKNKPSYTEVQCRRRFYLAMQEKCKNFGINDAVIEGPSGYGLGGEVENEILGHGQAQIPIWGITKLAFIASSYDAVEQTMADAKYNIYVKGQNARTILAEQRIVHSEYGTDLTDYYDVMFTKGGTKSGEALNLSAICYSPDFDGKLLLGVLRTTLDEDTSSHNRYKAMKLLMDIGKAKLANPSADISTLESQMLDNLVANATLMVVPSYNPRLYHDIDLSLALKLYGYNDNNIINTMSMIKYLTAMIMLDYVTDLNEQVTVTANDITASTNGSGQIFQPGDIVTYRDLLFALINVSSNPAGYAIARLIGYKLLTTYGESGFIPIS